MVQAVVPAPRILIAVAAIALLELAVWTDAQVVLYQDDALRVPAVDEGVRTARLTLSTPLGPAGPSEDTTHARSKATLAAEASLTPSVTVRIGSLAQRRRLEEALARFQSAKLLLPDLEVEFSDDEASCGGHHGLFQPGHAPWRIKICSPLDFVYEHELAHAWERANLTDDVRHEFMESRGYSTWTDLTVPWNERGIEGVAVVIQQGLAGLPLPPNLSTEQRSRLAAFSLLTGRRAPRLLEWCTDEHWGSQPSTGSADLLGFRMCGLSDGIW